MATGNFLWEKNMKVSEMIARVDEIRPNAFSSSIKLEWMQELLAKVKEEVWDTHEDVQTEDLYVKYSRTEDEINMNSEINVPASHMDFVEYWLMGKIDLANTDYERYSNSLVLFNSAYLNYRQWYNRNYMPKEVI